jgi:hypothetical protein
VYRPRYAELQSLGGGVEWYELGNEVKVETLYELQGDDCIDLQGVDGAVYELGGRVEPSAWAEISIDAVF